MMKNFTALVFGASFLAISLTGIANAQGAPQKLTMGDMPMMQNGPNSQSDPMAMCSPMMEGMMKDSVIHRRMNEMKHHGMGMGMGMGMMQNDPAESCSSMMQSMMKDPVIHRRMNEIVRKHKGDNSMNAPTSATPQPGDSPMPME